MMNLEKKTIMLDARIVIYGIEHGIARHVKELVFNIIQNKFHEKFNFVLLINKRSVFSDFNFPENFTIVPLKYGIFSLLSQFEVILPILKFKPNFFHSPQFIELGSPYFNYS